jgi:hypothetical protein
MNSKITKETLATGGIYLYLSAHTSYLVRPKVVGIQLAPAMSCKLMSLVSKI